MKKIINRYELNIIFSVLFIAFYMSLYYSLYYSNPYPGYQTSSYIILFSLLFLNIWFFIKTLFAFIEKKISINLFFIVSNLLIFSIAVLYIDNTLGLYFLPSKHKFKITILIQLIQIFFSICYFFGRRIIENIKNKNQNTEYRIFLILGAVFYSSIIVFFLSPLRIYATEPEEVTLKLNLLILYCFINFVVVFLLLLLFSQLFRVTPAIVKKIIITVFYFIASMVFVNTFIVPGNFGVIDKFILTASDRLYDNFYRCLGEVFLLIILFHVVLFLVSVNKTKILSIIFLILIIPAFLDTVIAVQRTGIKESFSSKNEKEETSDFLPKYNSKLMGFSKEGKNIVVFFFDMFSGGYMPRMFEEIPRVMENYTGFTWYPNTLTVGYFTSNSILAMYGGWKKSPIEINKQNTKTTLIEKIAESYEVLPALFEGKDYTTSYTDVEYYRASNVISSALMRRGVYTGFNEDYVPFWRHKNERSVQINNLKSKDISVQLLTMISIFKASPFLYKPTIYDKGDWLIIGKEDIKNKAYKHALGYWAFLDVMADVSNTNEKNNVFKYYRNNITHGPYAMSRDGILLKDEFPDPAAGNSFSGDNPYYSAKAAIEAVSRWITWLKESGIYDNTMIIIVSDHGNRYTRSHEMPKDFIVDGITPEIFNLINVILMVKPFNDNSSIKIDHRFMSNGDVPAIICAAVGIDNEDIGKDPTDGKAWKERVLDTIKSDDARGWEYLNTRSKYVFDYHYKVKNNLFDHRNWEKIK